MATTRLLLGNLDDDVLLHILSYLGAMDLSRVKLTCRALQKLAYPQFASFACYEACVHAASSYMNSIASRKRKYDDKPIYGRGKDAQLLARTYPEISTFLKKSIKKCKYSVGMSLKYDTGDYMTVTQNVGALMAANMFPHTFQVTISERPMYDMYTRIHRISSRCEQHLLDDAFVRLLNINEEARHLAITHLV